MPARLFKTRSLRKRKRQVGRVSLERALSKLGLASRGEARAWILAGRLQVDGKVQKNPLLHVVPETAIFLLDGRELKRPKRRVFAFHKPRGLVTTRSDEKGRDTVFDAIQKLERDEKLTLHAVGRLDRATTGLLLFTNDTRISSWLTDPKNAIPRKYLVTVTGKVEDESVRRLRKGIQSDGDFLKPKAVNLRKTSEKESHLVMVLDEGKNREIRRLFESIGHPVIQLKRVEFGEIDLDELVLGQWREIFREELERAFPGIPIRE